MQGERVRRLAPLRVPGNRSRLELCRCRGEYGCVWTTHARRTDAPDMPFGNADHTDRTRREESARALSGFAVPRHAPHRACPQPTRPAMYCARRAGLAASQLRLRQRRASRSQRPRTGVTREAVKRARSVTAAQVTDLRGSRKTLRRAQLFHAMSAGARTRCTSLTGPLLRNATRLAAAKREQDATPLCGAKKARDNRRCGQS